MVEIPVGREYVALVDDEDAALVRGYRWYPTSRDGERRYAFTNAESGRRRSTLLMHRLILDAPPGSTVDHADGDGLNNQRWNLRLASQKQNARNARPQRRTTSGYKGVTQIRSTGRWRAHITVDGRPYCLGTYESPAVAAWVYNAAASRHFEEFARPNPLPIRGTLDWVFREAELTSDEEQVARMIGEGGLSYVEAARGCGMSIGEVTAIVAVIRGKVEQYQNLLRGGDPEEDRDTLTTRKAAKGDTNGRNLRCYLDGR